MTIFRRKWTAKDADEWTREDWFAVILSPIGYVLLTLGILWSLLLKPLGFILLGCGGLIVLIMHLVIDPKLKAISEEYEKKQKDYLRRLERSVRWEED